MANLLLHSLKEFDEILFALIERVGPEAILEIGSETGIFSDRLLEHCEARGATLMTVEPDPSPHLVERALKSDRFDLYQGSSIAFLQSPPRDAQMVIIDGDHNYYTVFNELQLLHAAWSARGVDGIAILHDVGWPCARRDAYYDPASLPTLHVHPHSFDLGVTLDSKQLVRGAFRGEGHIAWALHEGGPRNGVLTAVEDFLREQPIYAYRQIDAVFGLGALLRRGGAAERHVDEVFAPYDNELLRRLERNRLELYLKVIEMQDALAARSAAPSLAPKPVEATVAGAPS